MQPRTPLCHWKHHRTMSRHRRFMSVPGAGQAISYCVTWLSLPAIWPDDVPEQNENIT
jgi:hypothetical protein